MGTAPLRILIIPLMVGFLVATALGQGDELREARLEATVQSGSESESYLMRFTFPTRGGKIRGEGRIERRFLDDGSPIVQVYTCAIGGEYQAGNSIPGQRTYRPDEGGLFWLKLHGREVTPPCSFAPNGRDVEQWREMSGFIEASGKGLILHGKQRLPFSFPPFGGACGCKLNLAVYGQAVRDKILDKLLESTSRELYSRFVSKSEEIASALLRKAQTIRALQRLKNYKLPGLTGPNPNPIPLRPPPDFLDKLQKNFENSRLRKSSAACAMLAKLASNLDIALKVLETAEAASAGDYSTAAAIASAQAVGSYSTVAGLAVALGGAVKADWDAYGERVHEKFFRAWYVKLYYQGDRPSEARWQAGRKARLQGFMDEAIAYLQTGGVQAAQLRKTLKDFAYYNLPADNWAYFGLGQRAFTDADFAVTEDGKLRSRYGGVALAALFQAYEETYRKDLDAELLRQLAIEQMKAQRKLVVQTNVAMEAATTGDFTRAWPHGEQCWRLRGIFEEVILDFKKRGLLNP